MTSGSGPAGEAPSRGPTDEELDQAVPRDKGGRELWVGVFVLLGLASFLAVLFLTTDPATFRGRYMVTTTVEDAVGLRKGDPIQMRGVNIGRVHDFAIRDDRVHITLEVEGRWEIPSDSRTELAGLGLLGGRTVNIIPGESPEPVPEGGIIPGTSGTGLLDQARDLGGEARGTLQRIDRLLSDPTVTSVQESARELEALLGGLSDFTRSQRAEVEELVSRLNRVAGELETATSESGPALAQTLARADSTMRQLQSTGRSLDRTAASLESVLARLERGEGTLGQLSANDSLYVNLNRAAESIRLLTDDIRENPGRYIRVSLF